LPNSPIPTQGQIAANPGRVSVPISFTPTFGFIDFDDVLDFLEGPPKDLDALVVESEGRLIETLLKFAQRTPQGRVVALAARLVIGLKIIKVVFGENDEYTGRTLIGGVDITDEFERNRPFGLADNLAQVAFNKRIGQEFTRAGIVWLDPIWLKDPGV